MMKLSVIRRLFFPPRCRACGERLSPFATEPTVWCRPCREEAENLSRIPCPRCGKEARQCLCQPRMLEKAGCQAMIKTGWYFPADRDAMARLIYHIKRYRDVDADALFARQGAGLLRPILMELGLGLTENTVIVGVPRSRRAIRKYGHDQARGLAAAWAREMKLPLSTALRRRRTFFFRTQEQKRLRSADRWHNTETAFVWRGGCTVRGKTVILVDDICTTGDTAAACCRQLLEAGATQVFLAVVAQTRDLAREWMRIGHPDGRVTRQADDAPGRTSLGGTPWQRDSR